MSEKQQNTKKTPPPRSAKTKAMELMSNARKVLPHFNDPPANDNANKNSTVTQEESSSSNDKENSPPNDEGTRNLLFQDPNDAKVKEKVNALSKSFSLSIEDNNQTNDDYVLETSSNDNASLLHSPKAKTASSSRPTYRDTILSGETVITPTPPHSTFLELKYDSENRYATSECSEDDFTICGNNKEVKYASSRYSIMIFLLKADVEASDEDAPILVIRKLNSMIRSLVNKLPKVRIGP